MRPTLGVLLLLGCRIPPGGPAPLGPVTPTAPEIVELSWTCENGRFSLDLTTDQWTGGGELWLTADGRYAERHPVPSIAAAPDGSVDELRLRLTAVADWRAARPGQSTAFDCIDAIHAGLVLRDWYGAVARCEDLETAGWRSIVGVPAECAES